ncbi:MAG TPA: hypothetical protein VFK54_04105 [Candidatus Limnocylindrales bacterium]|nr:hypothetical protein [Candidatus Limnocylindrales bacterium]
MRLSEWRAQAPGRETASAKVLGVVEPVLATFGLERDPECWIVWGDDPGIRWTLVAAAPAGLVTCHVRVNVPGEGPRASAKLTRWPRVQVGELAVETQGGHRLVTFQVENVVMRGADAEADGIGRFALTVFDGIDGRPLPEPPASRPARRPEPASRRAPAGATTRGSAAKSSTPKRSAAKASTALVAVKPAGGSAE